MTSSREYGLNGLGQDVVSLIKGFDCELLGFWKYCQFQEIWSWMVWVRNWST